MHVEHESVGEPADALEVPLGARPFLLGDPHLLGRRHDATDEREDEQGRRSATGAVSSDEPGEVVTDARAPRSHGVALQVAIDIRPQLVDGRVTLRGPVRSSEEKAAVAAKAEAALGAAVDNQLTVEPEKR